MSISFEFALGMVNCFASILYEWRSAAQFKIVGDYKNRSRLMRIRTMAIDIYLFNRYTIKYIFK